MRVITCYKSNIQMPLWFACMLRITVLYSVEGIYDRTVQTKKVVRVVSVSADRMCISVNVFFEIQTVGAKQRSFSSMSPAKRGYRGQIAYTIVLLDSTIGKGYYSTVVKDSTIGIGYLTLTLSSVERLYYRAILADR